MQNASRQDADVESWIALDSICQLMLQLTTQSRGNLVIIIKIFQNQHQLPLVT